MQFYFLRGFSQLEILAFLTTHDILISERTLQRILNSLGLFRRKNFSDVDEVIDFIYQQLQRSGRQHGYRFMHHKCIAAGLTVSRETVRIILGEIDPDGVALRRARKLVRRKYNGRGSNFIWHLDSYDKLKPYGICINGCIDGFSRKLLWLKAGKTSSDPKVIGGYFINYVETLGGCPRRIRADRGTENGHVAHMQRFLRENDDDRFAGENSFLYGRSTANQRIECWWGILRKENTEYWISTFRKLLNDGEFNGEDVEKELIRLCFLRIIQVSFLQPE